MLLSLRVDTERWPAITRELQSFVDVVFRRILG